MRPTWADFFREGSAAAPISIDLEDIVLRPVTKKKIRVGSTGLLSLDPTEWLNDCQVANLLALLQLPTAHEIFFLYPRDARTYPEFFRSKPAKKALTGVSSKAALILDYVDHGHWYKVILCIYEKVVYFWKPYGSKARANHPILKAFASDIAPLDDAWRFEGLEVKVQTDGVSCGVWDVVGDEAFVAYVSSGSFGEGVFRRFLVDWLQAKGVTDLNTIRGSGGTRGPCTQRNLTFINQRRSEMREQLLHAASVGKLVWHDGPLVDIFVPSERAAETSSIDLDALDE